MSTTAPDELLDVIIVGAGAAGVGVSVALAHAGIENFVALERHSVGASFARWPAETRFITPSFPTNSRSSSPASTRASTGSTRTSTPTSWA